jgi:hypothetical protein
MAASDDERKSQDYMDALRDAYQGRVPGGADLVTYWFEKARAAIGQGKTKHTGLVATNSIRGGVNRKVLEHIFELPFAHIENTVRPIRANHAETRTSGNWWQFRRSGDDLRALIANIPRYIATPLVSKHRIFIWIPSSVSPANLIVIIGRDDHTTFGILHSRFHEKWALRLGTSLEDRPRYTPSTTLETFPFPQGLTPDISAEQYANDLRAQKIAAAAKRLDELRNNWLNPTDLVVRVPEVVEGYPDRILPKNEEAAQVLKQRTLTNLYNERPAWLNIAHRDLDAAVAEAYGWKPDISDDEILTKLLALNVARAKQKPTSSL